MGSDNLPEGVSSVTEGKRLGASSVSSVASRNRFHRVCVYLVGPITIYGCVVRGSTHMRGGGGYFRGPIGVQRVMCRWVRCRAPPEWVCGAISIFQPGLFERALPKISPPPRVVG